MVYFMSSNNLAVSYHKPMSHSLLQVTIILQNESDLQRNCYVCKDMKQNISNQVMQAILKQ